MATGREKDLFFSNQYGGGIAMGYCLKVSQSVLINQTPK
jgi:hypothetical protein